jgi:hypothetical protein
MGVLQSPFDIFIPESDLYYAHVEAPEILMRLQYMSDVPKWDELISEEVFIALHPFLVISGLSPKRDPGSSYTITSAGKVLGQAPDYVRKAPLAISLPPSESEEQKRLSIGSLTKKSAENVRWEQVRSSGGFSSFADMQAALYSIVADYGDSFANYDALSFLTDYCDRRDIFFPTQGFIPPSLERNIGRLLEFADQPKVLAVDEFDIQKIPLDANQFLQSESVLLGLPLSIRGTMGGVRITSVDGRLQCSAMEGSFYTIIKTDSLEVRAEISAIFDGFWCDADRADSWWHRKIGILQSLK